MKRADGFLFEPPRTFSQSDLSTLKYTRLTVTKKKSPRVNVMFNSKNEDGFSRSVFRQFSQYQINLRGHNFYNGVIMKYWLEISCWFH